MVQKHLPRGVPGSSGDAAVLCTVLPSRVRRCEPAAGTTQPALTNPSMAAPQRFTKDLNTKDLNTKVWF